MVLMQLSLLTSGAAGADGLATLARRGETDDRFHGLSANLRSPASGWWTASRPDGKSVVMPEVMKRRSTRMMAPLGHAGDLAFDGSAARVAQPDAMGLATAAGVPTIETVLNGYVAQSGPRNVPANGGSTTARRR